MQDMVNARDALRRDSQQQLLVYINDALFSYQAFEVVETTKAKMVDYFCLAVHNIDKATNTMVDKCRILVYTVCKP